MAGCQCGGKPHLNRDHPCGCDKVKAQTRTAIKANLAPGARHEKLDGKDMLVVPVIMLRSDVVMNEVLVPNEEIHPIAWNGVPVTIHHPEVDQGFTSANSPKVMEDWACGTIFNSYWDAGILKAEAWIDVAKANLLKPGLVAELEEGTTQMDVSTGFFSDDENVSGESKGRVFSRIARNLNPDHLALLPGGTGACSWEDGCGIRANHRKAPPMTETKDDEEVVKVSTVTKLLSAFGLGTSPDLKDNRRGPADDYRMMVADLISSDASPFLPQDEDSLRMMSYDTLLALRNQYLGDPAGDINTNSDKEASVADEKDKGAAPVVTMEAVTKLVTESVTAAITEALKVNAAAAPALSADDRAALDQAKAIVADKRNSLIQTITANSAITKEQAEAMDDKTLAVVANGLPAPVADYSGRGLGANFNAAEDDDEAVKAMTSPDINAMIKANLGKAN